MLKINDIVCCCNDVDDDSVIFFVSRVKMLKIVVADFKCSSEAIINSEMTESINSDSNCF